MGEFFRGDEPEFQGPIQRAVARDADLWDSALDGGPERLVVLGRGSEFNRLEGLFLLDLWEERETEQA